MSEVKLARVAAFGALLLGALVWSRALANGFVHLDDPYYLTQNALVQRGLTWDGVVAAFTTPMVWNWHPLTMLSHMLDVELFGLAPTGHHLVSVLLHVLAAALLFCALREATNSTWLALFVAVAFAMHPLRVQSVAWASERKDVLSGAFWMGALWAHVRWTRTTALRPRVLAVALGACAMLSKPMAVTLPLTLLLFDAWPLGRLRSFADARARVLEQTPLLVAAMAVALMTVLAQDDAIQHAAAREPALRLAAGLVAVPRYLAMIAFPWPLSVSHGLYQEQPPPALALAAALALVGVALAAWRARARAPYLMMGLAWLVLTLLPVLGVVQVGAQAVADRYTYIPTIGVLLAAAAAAQALAHAGLAPVRRALPAVALAAIALWSWRTWAEIPAWHDSRALLDRAVAADPFDTDARVDRALAMGNAGDFVAAAAEIETASAQRANPHTWDLLGQAYARADRHADAVAVLETATTMAPPLAKVHVHLAESYAALDLRDDATRAIEDALRLEPASPRAQAVRDRLRAP